jgi:CheY-like chemotaxis protein
MRAQMSNQRIELLLIEDNPDDEELILHTLREANLINHVQVIRDGVEALDFLFGEYADAD